MLRRQSNTRVRVQGPCSALRSAEAARKSVSAECRDKEERETHLLSEDLRYTVMVRSKSEEASCAFQLVVPVVQLRAAIVVVSEVL